jgi:penicillin-binding protein 2
VTPIQLARAISGIASGGMLVRPHVAFPDELPPNMTQASNASDKVQIPMDPKNWQIITDAMANVTTPLGTANAAHLQDIDFAGKTGTAQTISNTAKAKVANGKARFKDNVWFVGVSPRRNPEIVVAVLFEAGELSPLAGIAAAKVVKAYVEKQRRNPPKLAEKPKSDGKVEIGGVWTVPDTDGDEPKLQGGHFFVDVAKRPLAVLTAAPGIR